MIEKKSLKCIKGYVGELEDVGVIKKNQLKEISINIKKSKELSISVKNLGRVASIEKRQKSTMLNEWNWRIHIFAPKPMHCVRFCTKILKKWCQNHDRI